MPLLIQTTGLEEYAPGGAARVKVLVIGGPGAGKTRWASYFPKPIYADCEKGLASVADRKVPFVNIRNSQDMLDLLQHLKVECNQPFDKRQFQTVVIDTLDAFQRKVKNEWMEKEKAQAFSGWEAWGYLNARMQMLMTRLLNLDMNVIVNVHYKDKIVKDKDGGGDSHELMPQLQGETADTAFNDFDLVGWMGTYWQSEDGQRVQKRGITFKPVPEKPFLKDRLHVIPSWLEVQFASSDYENLFSRIQARVAELDDSNVIGEVAGSTDRPTSGLIVTPGALGGGAVPGAATAVPKLTYAQMDKPTLQKMLRDRNITTAADGTPLRGNSLKSEIIAALEAADAAPATPEPTKPEDPEPPAAQPATRPDPTPPAAPAQQVAEPKAPKTTKTVADIGEVDTTTGEIAEPEPEPEQQPEPTIEAIAEQLDGKIIEDRIVPDPEATAAPAADEAVCADCGKSLSGENNDFVKLAWIKYRKKLCEADYRNRKTSVTR